LSFAVKVGADFRFEIGIALALPRSLLRFAQKHQKIAD
jgi:hypothetical protein